MVVSSPPQEVPLSTDGHVTLTCPCCKATRIASVEHYHELHIPIGVECICGHTYNIIIDTRQYYRKNLRLPGTYALPNNTLHMHITVETLSFSGLRFRAMSSAGLHVGDMLHLNFQLDNEARTDVHKQAVIRWLKNYWVGVKFCDVQTYNKELGLYLRPS